MRNAKKIGWMTVVFLSLFLLTLSACGKGEEKDFQRITQEEAKAFMDSGAPYVLLDVRTEEEYAERHIGGAILIPDYEIEDKAETLLPDKEKTVLVYCRSGRRSKLAAAKLAEMGYTDVREFGGINDWPYEVLP